MLFFRYRTIAELNYDFEPDITSIVDKLITNYFQDDGKISRILRKVLTDICEKRIQLQQYMQYM